MENLDIVNEDNELTGESAPRSRIHSEGIWHRVVHICLFRKHKDNLDFLVHLRSPFKDLHPNCWDFRFGGHIKSGSTLQESLENELQEEIGLDANRYELIEGGWHRIDKMPNREFAKTYYLKYRDNITDLKFNDGEVKEIKWMNIQEIESSMAEKPEKWTGNIKEFKGVTNNLLDKINQKP